jgi:DNA-binding GntR family transcriptional regulator
LDDRRPRASQRLHSTSRRGRTVLTLPEQIADDVGAAITRGEYREGDRLIEEELSALYGVSRGPVREALRLLAQRNLAEIYPRRGTYVTGVSLDGVVDLFNIRAVFMGLATRYFAIMAPEEIRRTLAERVSELEAISKLEQADAVQFQTQAGIISILISNECGSEALRGIIDHQNRCSAYRTLFLSGRVDFTTRERRMAAAADYRSMADAIAQHDGERAEAIMRRMVMTSREMATSALAALRGERFDERRLLKA